MPVPRNSDQTCGLQIKDKRLLLLERLQRENPVQRRTRTLYLPWAEVEISPCVTKVILHSMTHFLAFTFKEIFVSVRVYFKVECMIP